MKNINEKARTTSKGYMSYFTWNRELISATLIFIQDTNYILNYLLIISTYFASNKINKNTADTETIKVAEIPSEYRMHVSL